MSAPIARNQMTFELPKLSYIDTRFEEPAVPAIETPVRRHRIASWIARQIAASRNALARGRAMNELSHLTDRELMDVGLNRGDLDRIFDDRLNADLRYRGRGR